MPDNGTYFLRNKKVKTIDEKSKMKTMNSRDDG